MSNLPVNTLLQGGKYRIKRFINSGGFGCTYEAEHVLFESRVAIKEFFVKDFCNRDERTAHVTVGTTSKKGLVEKLRGKFVDEAKALNKLQHPGIVHVSDIFEENGTAYYVMDYIDGPSLSDLVKREGPLPEARAVGYIRQVCEALQYVHSQNRLHLDIKPANVMVDGEDRAILIDFGVSKQYDECDGENTSTLMGKTPGYAPLEQLGNDVMRFLPATDIYALGATLYKLLTGVTPLPANRLASGDELLALPAGVSAVTRNAVFAAMRLNKNERPQSVAAFVALLGGGGGSGPKPVADKSHIGRYVAIVACVVGAIIGIWVLMNRGKSTSAPTPLSSPETTVISSSPQPSPTPSKPVVTSPAEPAKPKLVLISGTVTDETTGKPVSGAQVKSSDGNMETTDRNGKYSFAGGVEENAKLSVVYESKTWKTRVVKTAGTYDFKLPLPAKSEPMAQQSPISSGSPAVPPQSQGGAANGASKPKLLQVKGTVTDETTGKPISGAQVKSSDGNMATTDGNGKYAFTNSVEENAQLSVVYESKTWETRVVKKAGTYDFKLPLPVKAEPIATSTSGSSTSSPGSTSGRSSNNTATPTSHKINGHEYVDLGLSVKWATCNVGASSPYDYGNHYAWGEVSAKDEYTKRNSETSGKSFRDIGGNPQYDAARANWGGTWRLPTKSELEELKNNCTWEWVPEKGKEGYKVTGRNGNSIFLPAAGCRYGSSLYYAGSSGYYWSSTPYESNTYGAYELYFLSSIHLVDWNDRGYGRSVRPVSE